MNRFHAESEEPKNKNDPGERNWQLQQMRAEAISTCRDWFDKDRQAKQPYLAEMDEMYKLYKSDHWNLLDESGHVLRTDAQKRNHPNAVENTAFALIEGMVAEFSDTKELIDYPQEEGDDESAIVMTELKEFIAYKNRLEMETLKWNRWFFLYGTGIWEKNWDPSWKGGKGPNRWTGDIRWKACHPRTIVPDARCLDSFEDGRRLHKAIYWTVEEVEETWPEAEGIAPDSLSNDFMISEELEDTSAETNEDQVLVIDTYYKGRPMILDEGEEDQGPGLHLIQWAGEGTLKYLAHQNYLYFDPEESVEFPIKGYKCYERERSPWGLGEAYYLKNPQIIKNKTAELIIEGHVFQSVGQTWFEEGSVTEKQKRILQDKGALPGMWFEVVDVDGIKREYPRSIPASLASEAARLDKVMEYTVGRFDISQGKTPGSVTAFRALDLLASRAQKRLSTKDKIINTALEDCGNYINRLITRNYTEKRRYRILGKEDNISTWNTYDGESMKKAYLFDTDKTVSLPELAVMTQDQDSLPEEDQLLEGRDYEVYSPEFDAKCKITSEMPTDRIFYMEMAKDLFGGQLIDEETFFYVIEHGKFPPIEDILRKAEERQQEAMMQNGGMQGQPPEQAIEQFISLLKTSAPDVLLQLAKMPEEQRLPALLELMRTTPPEMLQQLNEVPTNPNVIPQGVPPETDAQRIKQNLINVVQSAPQ